MFTLLLTAPLFAQFSENEPNGSVSEGNIITTPGTYTGTINGFSDVDYFIFPPSTDANVTFTVTGPQLGLGFEIRSSTDPSFQTFNVVTGPNPTESAGLSYTFDLAPNLYYAVIMQAFSQTNGNYSIDISVNSGSIPSPSPTVNPGGVAGANLWYKADAGVTASGGFMSKWENKGSLGSTADAELLPTQAANSHPEYIATGADQINFNPSVKFDGVNDFIQTGLFPTFLGTAADKNVSQFVVYKKLGANNTFIWNIDNGLLPSNSGTLISLGAKSDGQLLQSGQRLDFPTASSQNETVLIDMVATTSATAANQAFSLNKNGQPDQNGPFNNYEADNVDHPLRFGRFQNNFGHALIAELVVYPTNLPVKEKQKVQSYLSIKYGLSLGNNDALGIFVNSSGISIYLNPGHNFDIFGIGKDDGSGLNQPQSNSMNTGMGDGTGQSGKGNIVLSNPSSLDDGDYLMIGNDGEMLTEQNTDLPTSLAGKLRLTREWKVSHTQDVGTVNLTFSTLGLSVSGNTAADFKLLIDTDGDGDFTNGKVTVVNATNFAGNVVSFDSVTLPDDAVFTILTGTAPSVAPGGVTGSNLWLKANQGATNSGSNLTGWTDKTGTNTFTVTGTPAYATDQINFNPGVSFDNDEAPVDLPGAYLAGNQQITFVEGFAVYNKSIAFSGALVGGAQPVPNTWGKQIFGGFQGDEAFFGASTQLHTATDPRLVANEPAAILNYSIKASNNFFSVNGEGLTPQFPDPTLTTIALTPWIGGTNNGTGPAAISGYRHFRGQVAEIILFSDELTPAERAQIQSYLGIKYGISLAGNYVNSAGTTLWDATANTTYQNDVFGIGRDDSSGLNQASSNSINTGSGDGTGQSGKGNIVLSNPSNLDDGEFLMLGHDNGALTEQTTEVPTAGQSRITREWFVKRTGDRGTVDLSFDIAGLTLTGTTAADFKLLIDTDGDFSSGATEINAASLTGTKVEFTGVSIPDGSVLTILTLLPGPGGVGAANLWLKANDGATNSGGNLTGWVDQTGTNTFTVNGTPGYASDAINFNPVVTFDNAQSATQQPGDYLEGNTSITYQDGFAVFKKTNAASGALIGSTVTMPAYGTAIFAGFSDNQIWMTDGAGSGGSTSRFENQNVEVGNVALVGYDISAGLVNNAVARLNGANQSMIDGSFGIDNTSATFTPRIGGTNNIGGSVASSGFTHFRGEVAELILYPTSTSAGDKFKVQSYLAIKYGITLESGINYVASDGTIVWSNTRSNTTYWNDVFGIGRDDNSALLQNQSNSTNTGSGDGTGQTGLGNIVLRNPSSLDDGDFLMIGNDNGALTEQSNDIPAGLNMFRLGREWKVQRTGDPGDVDLEFDFNGLNTTGGTTDVNDYRLLIDEDGDGDFTTGTVQQIKPVAFGSPKLIFNGVNLPNGAVLAFATGFFTPSWTISKSSITTPNEYDDVGDVLTYEIILTNTGNVSISGVIVTDPNATVDPNFSGDTGSDNVLSPNEVWTYSASHTVTQADIEAGSYTNTATASGTPAAGTLTPATSNPVTVQAVQTPDWTFEKVAKTPSFDGVGQTLVYQFLVTNTGNVNITSIDVFDETLNRAPNLLAFGPTTDGILNPGEVWTYATVYKTTQSDLDRGFFTNIARANGNSVAGPMVEQRDTETVNATQSPSFTFEKKALTPSFKGVNDPITYQLVLKNTGNVTLRNSTISDPLIGLNQSIAQGIAPGDSLVISGNYKVTQADIDAGEFVNTATATTEGPSGALPAATDTARVAARQSPSWTLSKTSNKSTYSQVGEVIDYTFTLTNTGNVSISNVVLTDDKVSPAPTLQSESFSPADNILSPGETFVYTASYSVTQADIDAGTIVNNATASGTPPTAAPNLADATASDTLNVQPNPSVVITKTANKSSFVLPGEVITYSFEVENTGNVTLTNVSVSDPLAGLSAITPASVASMAPGTTEIFTATYSVTQADLDAVEVVNIATVTGEDPFNTTVTGSGTLRIKAKIAAVLDLDKTASPTVFVNAGEVVTYTFVLTNTGNVTLSNIVLDDPRISFNQAVQDLTPGQATTITHSYTLTQDDINAQGFVNTATATATSPLGKSVSATDQAAVTAQDKGALDINKVALDQTYTQLGEVIDFEITVTNVGNVTIDNVVVTDVLTNLNVPVGTLNPGQSSSVIPTSYTIQQADLDAGQVINIASVTGVESTPQATPVNAQDRALSVGQVRDAIIFTKVAQTADFDAAGDILAYKLTVENAGNVTLNNVVVSDPLATVVNPNIGTLFPGQVVTLDATYTVQQADVDRGFFENIAAVTGTDPFGTDVSELARATVQGLQTPSISLSKTGSPTSYSTVGETITYTLEVTNTGNVTLTSVQLVDSLTNTNQTVSASLAPNQSASISGTYTVTQVDIDRGSIVNTASTNAQDPANQSQQTQASFTVTASQSPQLTFTKSAAKTDYDSLGKSITYELVVSNPGNVTLKNVIVTDPLTGLNSNIGNLAPNQSKTIQANYLVTQAELDAGSLTNTASVIASPPTGTPLNQQTSVTLAAVQNPSVDIQKNALTSTFAAVGDVLDYEIIVTNTGNVTLTNVTVQDPLVSINSNIGVLLPGDSQTLTGSYAVRQADLDAGNVVNIARVDAVDTNSNPLNDQATATVTATSNPGITIQKTANKQNFQTLGEEITYTFSVENTGNVTLSNVVVTDAKTNFTSNPPSTLLPGSTGIFVTTYQVSQADLDAGEIVNIAGVTAQDPFATAVQDADTLSLVALQNKALELRKTTNTTLFNAAGEVVTYNFQVTNIGNVTLDNVVIDDPRIPFNQVVGSLAPNQASQFAIDYTLTQSDVDALQVVNVATATGTAPDNTSVTTSDNNTITIAGRGALQLDKTAIQKTYDADGDVLDFELKVTNIGTVTINNVRLTDAVAGIIDLDLGSLAPGASTTVPATYAITQPDVDAGQFQNQAFVQGVENTPQATQVSAQDAVIVLATSNPSIQLDKLDLSKTYSAAGTTLNYQLLVTNKGNVTLTNIRLTDPLTGLDQVVQNIPPGQSRTITTSYNTTQADMDSGSVTNTAAVTASTFGNQNVQDSDQVVSQAILKPSLIVTKTSNVSSYQQVGDLVTYTIEVTNNGNVTLTNVIATDPLTNTNQNLGNLVPGQKASITEQYQISQADIDAGKIVNTAAVIGTDPKGNSVSGTASNTIFADQKPVLELTKTATPNTFDQVGDVITYQLVVRNTGNVTLSKASVTDPLTGFNVNLDTIAVGATKTVSEVFTVSQQDIDRGFVLNTANSQALDPNSQKVAATANARVDAVQNPGIGLKKTTTTPTYSAVGDLVEFEIEVTNTGNETLNNVTVVDPLTNLNQNIGTLDPAQSQTVTTSYTVEQGDLDAGKIINTAAVSGTDLSSQTVQANAGSQATAIQNPSVSLTKIPNQSTYSQNGESITFDLVVENTGNVTLTNLVIKDPLTSLNQTVATLVPGQSTSLSTSYSVTQQDLDKGQFVNTGIVEASTPGGVTVSDSQNATITATFNASVEITKSATPTTYSQVGDVIRYVLKVTNTGNVTTNTIRVVDPLTGLDRNLGILSPKKTLTLNESYTITQQDIDRGQVVNTATVTAASPAGAPVQDDAAATVTAVQNPGINLVKTTNTPIYNQAGDVIDFTLTVTNTGNETLFKVKVIDPLTGLNQTIGTLTPGQSTSISTSYMATQADVDFGQINNSATVSGFDPSNKKVESTAQSIATAIQNSAISVTKTATPIDYDQVGDVITYQIVVTNSGNISLTNVTVSDPLTNTNQTIPTLLPSQKVTVTEKYTITQTDLDAGQVANTVDVSGTDSNGLTVQATASATAFALQNPGIGLIKTTVAPGTYTKPGDLVEFELIVENTGNETLDNVTVVDPLTGLNQAIGTLIPGQRSSLTTSYSVTQADIDQGIITNTAAVSGVDPNNQTLNANATSLANAVISSDITLEKTTQATSFSQVGELIPYEIKVENTGNTTLSNISINDPKLGLTQNANTLAPGQVISISRNYSVTQADLDAGFILNIADVKSTDPFNTIESSVDSVRVLAVQSSGITISKTPAQPTYSYVGEVIGYDLLITNTGNVTLTNLVVIDPLTNLNQALSDLLPGENTTVTTSYTIIQSDLDAGQVDNTATISGTDPSSGLIEDTSTATVTAVQTSDLILTKTVTPSTYDQVGGVLTYTLSATNSGNVTLTDVTISDPLTGLSQTFTTLVPGNTVTLNEQYTVTQQDIDSGQIDNIGTVTGEDPNQTILTATAQAVSTAVQTSDLILTKTVTPFNYDQVGDVLTYTLSATNSGNVTLTDVTISDPLTGLSQTFTTLVPGNTVTLNEQYTVTQQDIDSGQIDNIGTVTGEDPNQTILTATSQAVSTAVQTSDLILTKTVTPFTYDQVGDVLTYTLSATNSGNVTLTNVTISDPLTGLSQTFTTLVPGNTVKLNEQYTVTQQDVDNGQVINTATVTATDPNQQTQTSTASAAATAVQNPGIGLIKSVDKKEYSQAGEVLTYTLTVENTGNETLDNVTVVDPLTGLTQNVGTLTPGQSQTVTTAYTVTQQDIDSGQIDNIGTVTGEDPNQTILTATAQAVSTAVQTSDLILTKTVTPFTYDQIGDVLTYTIKATNSGNVTLTNVTVTDPLTGLSQTATTLAPGKTLTVNEQYTVTQQDVDNGQVINTATVTATDPNQQTQTSTASATATAVQNPGIGLIKSVDKKEYSQAGEVLTYTLTVENTGNETLDNVTVVDPLTNLTQNVGTLTPGQSQTVTTAYTVTQQDIDSGQVLNTGSVTGEDPNQTVLTATAQAVSFAVIDPKVSLIKNVDQGFFTNLGDILNYELILTNTGNITLNQLTISDPLTGLNEQVDELKVGETLTLQTSYTVTQEDLDKGIVKNIATLTAVYIGTFEITAIGERSSVYLPIAIEANDDNFGEFPLSYGGLIGNILENDLYDGSRPDPNEVELELLDEGGLVGINLDNEGNLILILGLNQPGTYLLKYRLSLIGNDINQDEAFITILLVDDRVDLGIQKSTLTDEIYEGDEFEYEILLENIGGTDARGVVLSDELPEGLTFISQEVTSVSDPQIVITSDISNNVVSWQIPLFPADAQATVSIKVKAINPGMITNIASVSSEGLDTDESNNEDSVSDEILAFRITNVITPNADGLNDEFEIKGLDKFVQNRLVIFNRLGDHVFEIDDYQNNWSAEGLDPGTYFYVMTSIDSSGGSHEFKGWIQVIKE